MREKERKPNPKSMQAEIFVYCCNCSSPRCTCGAWFDFLVKSLNVKTQTPCTHELSRARLAGQQPPLLEDTAVPKNTPHHKAQLGQSFCPLRLIPVWCAELILGLSLEPFTACGVAQQDRDRQAHRQQKLPLNY